MDSMKEFPDLKNQSPAMIRRLRTSFLAFCLLILAISTFLLWTYGATLPRVFHGFEDVDENVQGEPASQSNSASTVPATKTSPDLPAGSSASEDGAGIDQSGSTNLPYFDLVWWLRSIGRVPGKPLIFMVGGNADMAHAFNMYDILQKYGRHDNFFLMCTQKACLDAPDVYTYDVVGMNRRSVKIAASIQLLREGWNFIFLDPDVYLTDALDPISQMLPMDEPAWDIQFAPGPAKGAKGLDASFFWARPNKYTREFFRRVKNNWSESGDQDLNSLMNIVAFEMSNGQATLKLKILGTAPFKSWGDYIEWESKNFNNKDAINTLYNQTAAVHMTCVEPQLRPYLARNFGAWTDVESYYTGSRKFLGVKGLEGDASHASRIIGFAAKVAMDTQRTLIFPSSAILTQARKNANTGASDYVTVPEFPAYRIVDPSSLDNLNLHVVEAMYLNNKARYTRQVPSQDVIIMGNGHSVKDPKDGKPVVVRTIKEEKKDIEVVWLDMGSGRWWDLDASGAMALYTKDVQATIKSCTNANEESFECDKRCV
ncbi:hypothetical protein H072_7338 [Dactylellina haptotyla CBS 200.50]|uniref:Nucleotide-diphospho-sugar transferase domain-containing protein n=1 Tax=Dactylellina haptotyla (strain CBS 200.50) TaxID=1284197 RepID=S8A7E9_DACHA|nr:hypothetical protein H072_7338 [Dactylellina haptotyla CBS 200.50]